MDCRLSDALKPHYNDALRYCRALCAPWSASHAEDVLQQALLDASAHFGELRDAARFKAWLFRIITRAAGPLEAKAGVILMHDWFGVTDMTRETIDRLGALGYRAIAVDYLARPGRRIAAMGFSMGGAIALRTSLLDPKAISATVVVYGGGLENRSPEELRTLRGPLLMVTGTRDQWALDSTLAMIRKMGEIQRAAEAYLYPGADHGFAQPLYAGGDNLDPTSTRVSWMVIEDFLRRNLGWTLPLIAPGPVRRSPFSILCV